MMLLTVIPSAATSFDANPLTAMEAQSLSVADLAKRVLGEAGANVQGVQRPEWGPGAAPAPPDFIRLPQFRGTPWTPSEPPPLGRQLSQLPAKPFIERPL